MTKGRPGSGQLLLELVNETLDPGYAAAARRRAEAARQGGGVGPPRRSHLDRPAVALGCLVIGFLLVVAYVHTHRDAPQAATVHAGLVQRVRSAQSSADELAGQLAGTERDLAQAQDRLLPVSGTLARRRDREQLDAGQTAVSGPGLTVTLRAPPTSTASSAGRGGTLPITAGNILTDRDVRSVVNELWVDGAEAVAVNGVRLTATSAIRFAGQAVLVDLQPISSPYTIEAIGDADRLATAFAQSAVAGRYQTLVSADGIGFTFRETDGGELHLPAAAALTPRYAHPAATPTPAPNPAASPTTTRTPR